MKKSPLLVRALRGRAEVYNIVGATDKSISDCKKALARCRALDNTELWSEIIADLGDILIISKCDYEGARILTENALKSMPRKKFPRTYARCLTNLGIIAVDIGDHYKGLKYYQEVLPIYRSANDQRGLALTYHNVGNIYCDKGNHNKALEYFNKSLALFKKVNDLLNIGEVYNELGYVNRCINQPGVALEYYDKSLSILSRIGYKLGVCIVLDNIAVIHNNQNNPDAAIECNQNSLAISKEIGNSLGEAIALYNMGQIYRKLGDINKALMLYSRSFAMLTKLNYQIGIAMVNFGLGKIYHLKGNYERALGHYANFLNIVDNFGDRSHTGLAHQNIGTLKLDTGKLTSAKKHLDKAEKLYADANDRTNLSSLYSAYARLAMLRNEKNKAARFAEKALAFAEKNHDVESKIIALRSTGRISSTSDPRLALSFLKKALHLAVKHKLGIAQAESFIDLANVYRKTGEKKLMRESLEKARGLYLKGGMNSQVKKIDRSCW